MPFDIAEFSSRERKIAHFPYALAASYNSWFLGCAEGAHTHIVPLENYLIAAGISAGAYVVNRMIYLFNTKAAMKKIEAEGKEFNVPPSDIMARQNATLDALLYDSKEFGKKMAFVTAVSYVCGRLIAGM